jgi:hypothetical protein
LERWTRDVGQRIGGLSRRRRGSCSTLPALERPIVVPCRPRIVLCTQTCCDVPAEIMMVLMLMRTLKEPLRACNKSTFRLGIYCELLLELIVIDRQELVLHIFFSHSCLINSPSREALSPCPCRAVKLERPVWISGRHGFVCAWTCVCAPIYVDAGRRRPGGRSGRLAECFAPAVDFTFDSSAVFDQVKLGVKQVIRTVSNGHVEWSHLWPSNTLPNCYHPSQLLLIRITTQRRYQWSISCSSACLLTSKY